MKNEGLALKRGWPALSASLEVAQEGERDLGWLAESRLDPTAFFELAWRHNNEGVAPLQSRFGKAIDWYHDAISRHLARDTPAWIDCDARGKWQDLSFRELDAAANKTAWAWALAGVTPGSLIALVLPQGRHWAIALAAALRSGACVCVIDVAGPRQVANRLACLKPEFVVAEKEAGLVLQGAYPILPVCIEGPETQHAAVAYAPEAIVCQVLSPLYKEPVPLSVNAETLLGYALSDGALGYGLQAGYVLATPGFAVEQHQPCLFLATLLAGASFAHFDPAILRDKPQVLCERKLDVLGISSALCKHLGATPLPRPLALKHWLRQVDEALDVPAWATFLRKNQLEACPVANVLVDTAAAGCLLISARSKHLNAMVLPAPARPLLLQDPVTGKPASHGSGVFDPSSGEKAKREGYFLLVERGPECLYALTLEPRRGVRRYPASEVTACVSELAGVDGAHVIALPRGDVAGAFVFVLLIFAQPNSQAPLTSEFVEMHLHSELGPDALPDSMQIFNLWPRLKSPGKLDAGWCERQYAAGFLDQKLSHPVFVKWTGLRRNIQARHRSHA